MNNQDPVREYIINEILKNIIYINLIKEKNILINIKNNKKLKTEELNNLQNKIDIINNDIDLISKNKEKNYNQLIYRRFINNYNTIKNKIKKKDEKYEELIKTYQLLISNNYINPNKKIKHLKNLRNELITYIPTDNINIEENISQENDYEKEEKNKKKIIYVEKELNNIIDSNNEIEKVTKDNIKTILQEVIKDNDNNINKALYLVRVLEKINTKNQNQNQNQNPNANANANANPKDKKSGGKINYKSIDTYNSDNSYYSDDSMNSNSSYIINKTFKKLYKKFIGGEQDKTNDEKIFNKNININNDNNKNSEINSDNNSDKDSVKSNSDKSNNSDKDSVKSNSDNSDKDSVNSKSDKSNKSDKDSVMSDKDSIIKKKSKKMKKLLKKLKRKSINLNVNTLEEKNNDIIIKKKNLIQQINDNKRNIDEYFEQFGSNIKNLSTKLTQIEEYYDKFSYEKNNSKIENFNSSSRSIFQKDISKYKTEYLDFINSIDYLTNDDSIIFNNSSGIHKKIEDIISTFVKFKSILSDDNNSALEILFNNSNTQRVNIISQIDNYIEKIKTNIYKDLIDLKENLIKFKSSLKNYYNKLESQYEKIDNLFSSSSERVGWSSTQSRSSTDTFKQIKDFKDTLKQNNEENFGNAKWSNLTNKINKTNINAKYETFKITLKDLFNLYNKIHESIDNNSYTDIISSHNEDGDYITYDNINETDNIFNQIWNKYLTSKNENSKINDEIEKDFYNSVKTNDLDPEKVLEINQNDKIIFIILIFVIRQISLIIVEYMIDNNNIRSLFYMLLLYLIFYITILIIFIIIVNIDVYKLRILFNYLNFHINSNGIIIHIILLILFTIILYYYLYNIDNKLKETKDDNLYEIEKIEYKYKLEIITLIIFVFTSIINYLI